MLDACTPAGLMLAFTEALYKHVHILEHMSNGSASVVKRAQVFCPWRSFLYGYQRQITLQIKIYMLPHVLEYMR